MVVVCLNEQEVKQCNKALKCKQETDWVIINIGNCSSLHSTVISNSQCINLLVLLGLAFVEMITRKIKNKKGRRQFMLLNFTVGSHG